MNSKKVCPNCGEKIKITSVICEYCGQALSDCPETSGENGRISKKHIISGIFHKLLIIISITVFSIIAKYGIASFKEYYYSNKENYYSNELMSELQDEFTALENNINNYAPVI